jgi:UDP-glucose 4-epimerase
MQTLVTGGAGFIGSNLVDALLAEGHDVAILDDFSTGKEENVIEATGAGATVHRADVRNALEVDDVFAVVKPDVVFHLAAQIDVRKSVIDPAFDARTNVEGTINVLNGAKAVGARVIFISTGGAIYGETDVIPTPETVEPLPEAPYGQSKYCAERYLGLYARLFGEQTRDYVYVGDVVGALLAVLAHPEARGEYNVGTGRESSVLEIVAALAEQADGDFEPEFAEARPGELDRSCLDVTRAREELGWAAEVDLREGLRRTVEWARSVTG